MSLQAIPQGISTLSARAWREFDEHLTSLYWQPLWEYVTIVARELPSDAGYVKKTGELHRSQLAKRLGIDNSCLSKPQWGGPKMQLRNFLVTLAVCNIDWHEVNFPPPISAVLLSLRSVFPTISTSRFNMPTIEDMLVLYFSFNNSRLPLTVQVTKSDVLQNLRRIDSDWILDRVRHVEWNRQVDSDCESIPLISQPNITDFGAVWQTIEDYGDAWAILRRIFPFLVSQTPDDAMQDWQPAWGFM